MLTSYKYATKIITHICTVDSVGICMPEISRISRKYILFVDSSVKISAILEFRVSGVTGNIKFYRTSFSMDAVIIC